MKKVEIKRVVVTIFSLFIQYAGQPWKTQKRIHMLQNRWFRNDLMGIPAYNIGKTQRNTLGKTLVQPQQPQKRRNPGTYHGQ